MRKVLLDENLPHALEAELSGFDVWTVGRTGEDILPYTSALREAVAAVGPGQLIVVTPE